jgi:hypothetical protein
MQWRPLMPLTAGACILVFGLLLGYTSLTNGRQSDLAYALGPIIPGGVILYRCLRTMLAHRRARLAGLVTVASVTGVQGFGRSFLGVVRYTRSFLGVVRYTYVDHRGRERRGSSDFFFSSRKARAWVGKRGLVLFSPDYPDVTIWLGHEVTDDTPRAHPGRGRTARSRGPVGSQVVRTCHLSADRPVLDSGRLDARFTFDCALHGQQSNAH